MKKNILRITDLTDANTIDLLGENGGFRLKSWDTLILPDKSAVWTDNPFTDGRKLVSRLFDDVTDSISLSVNYAKPLDIANDIRRLRILLRQAVSYWTSSTNQSPVYIEKQGPGDTKPLYSIIKDWRTPADRETFGDPFASLKTAPVIDDFDLILTHGAWLSSPVSIPECLYGSNNQYFRAYDSASASYILNPGIETAGTPIANWTCTTQITRDTVTKRSGAASAKFASTVGFDLHMYQDFAVTPGALFTITFYHNDPNTGNPATSKPRYRLEDRTNPGTYIIPLTYVASTTPGSFVLETANAVIPTNCALVRLDIYDGDANNSNWYFDDFLYQESPQYYTGETRQCGAGFYVENCYSTRVLTDIYTTLDNVTFSINKATSAVPFTIFNTGAAPAYTYFGIRNSISTYAGHFWGIVFNLSNAASFNGDFDVQYWNGATWANCANVVSELAPCGGSGRKFNRNGIGIVTWTAPTDWTTQTVNGIAGRWVRFVFTARDVVGNITQVDFNPYTPIADYIEVSGDDIAGDLRALLRAQVKPYKGPLSGGTYSIYAGSRSVSRGASFSPHLNLSSLMKPADITISLGAGCAFTARADSPTDQIVRFTAGGATASVVNVSINSPLAKQYIGRYRVLLKFYQNTGSAGQFKASLQIGGIGGTDVLSSKTTGAFEIFDFGPLDFPGYPVVPNGEIASISISIVVQATAALNCDLFEVTAIPIDEWTAEIKSTLGNFSAEELNAEFGSLYPKNTYTAAYYKIDSSCNIIYGRAIQVISANEFSLEPKETQRVFLTSEGGPDIYFRTELDHIARFFDMSGDE